MSGNSGMLHPCFSMDPPPPAALEILRIPSRAIPRGKQLQGEKPPRSSTPSPPEMNIFPLRFRPRFVPHIKEEPCTRCLRRGNSSGTLVGPRKVPAAGGDSAVGGAEREGSEVTAPRRKTLCPSLPSCQPRAGEAGELPSPTLGFSSHQRCGGKVLEGMEVPLVPPGCWWRSVGLKCRDGTARMQG